MTLRCCGGEETRTELIKDRSWKEIKKRVSHVGFRVAMRYESE